MLPTKGYFQDIECPYLDNSCNRPYCHFRHKKKGQDNNIDEIPVVVDNNGDDDNNVINKNSNNSEIPTYKPTPKSELANIRNHIPISYVPDLEFRSTGRINRTKTITTTRMITTSTIKPTYKPTPLSVLSSVSKQDETNNKNDNSVNNNDDDDNNDKCEVIKEIQQNIASVEYYPEIPLHSDINFEELTTEFKLIDDIIEKPTVNNSVETCEKKETKEHKKNEETSIKSKEKTTSDKNHSSRSRKHKSSDRDRDKDKKRNDEKSKHSDRSRHKSSHKRSSSDKNRRHRKHSREREKDHNKKKRKDDKHDKNYSSDNDCDNNEIDTNFDVQIEDDDDDDDEDDTLMECYKIFNEYQPEKPDMETTSKLDESKQAQSTKADIQIGKKRIAHTSSLLTSLTDIQTTSKLPINKPKIQQNPALVMTNRFKLAKLSQGNSNSNDNNQKLELRIIEETKQSLKRPLMNPIETNPNKRLMKSIQKSTITDNVNLIDSIINGSKSQPKFTRKIAPVLNVNSIQKAKAKIEELTKTKTVNSGNINKTPAQSLKNAKRTAHIPDVSLSNLPDVLNADKSKLPVNVRTRFLTMIADECVKLYLNKEDAYNRALNEEFTCYEKCKVLLTYKNSVMLSVNRLRKEFQEREKSGLGPIDNNESSNNQSTITKDKQFYDYIKSYVLTEEELDLHGYPRESSTPGRAIIKNRKNQTDVIKLKKNQRKCCRCSKIFLVDIDGFALYNEECLYHPLKKRTLRGEQTYLCCKSNDDTGCVTSNTHVSDMGDNIDLDGFQTTLEPDDDNDPRSYAVYALDCEMCYTIKGLELTRITIVDTDCKTVYESLVKPLNPIIDYNTQFSGITKEQMDKTSTNILQVQANILHLCNSKTILIGHSLESDMKALKIIHNTVIDTSVLFPHKMGLPHKRALKALASDFLKKIIQNNVSGHDSAEDAITCMELVKWKLNEELKVRGIKLVV